MEDLSSLLTQSLSGSPYESASEFYRPPEPGKEIIVLKEFPKEENFYSIKDFETGKIIPGFSVNAHWAIQGGKQDGQEFYAFINTQKKLHRNGNDVQDYILALIDAGQSITKLETYSDLKEAFQMYMAPVLAQLTWIGRPEAGGKTFKLKDFPMREDGTRNHVITVDGEDIGAQVKISAIFPASKAKVA